MKRYQWAAKVIRTRSVGSNGWSEVRLCPVIEGKTLLYVRERKNGHNPVSGAEGTAGARWLREAAGVLHEWVGASLLSYCEARLVVRVASDAALSVYRLADTTARWNAIWQSLEEIA